MEAADRRISKSFPLRKASGNPTAVLGKGCKEGIEKARNSGPWAEPAEAFTVGEPLVRAQAPGGAGPKWRGAI